MKKAVYLALALSLILILSGCVTTSEISEMTPLNLYSKRKFSAENRVYFVGEGRAETQRQAELLSYVDLYSKVYRYLGVDEEPESYRELTTSGTISAYNLKIQEKSSYTSEGTIIVALVASADETLLAADRSPDMLKEQEIAEKAINLVLQGDQCVMENHDIEGLKFYLQSMVYSYGLQYIEDEFSFTSILEEVLNVIDALSIKISKENPEEMTCKIRVTRNDSLVPSKVKNSLVKATFKSEDSRGQVFEDSFTYTTDNKGVIDFVPKAYNIENKGTVCFNFDFNTELEDIEKLSPFTASTIKKALQTKTASFEYDKKLDVAPIAICVQCIGYQGDESLSSWLADFIVGKYAEDSIDAYAFEYVDGESTEEMFSRFKNVQLSGKDIVVFRVGVDSAFETRMDISSIGVEGSVVVYNSTDGSILYDSGASYANGFGSSLKEAQEDAFKNFALKMFTLLKAYYV